MEKKSLISLILIALLLGCSKESSLIWDAEKYLISLMNDPNSYKREWYQIQDTITKLKFEMMLNEEYIKELGSEIPAISRNLSINEFNINQYKSFGSSGKNGLYWENKRYKENLAKINTIESSIATLSKRNDFLSKQKDNTEIKYINILIRYQAKNVYGGTVRELCTISCTPTLINQKTTWTFESINTEAISNR
jgi:hypothetical protein